MRTTKKKSNESLLTCYTAAWCHTFKMVQGRLLAGLPQKLQCLTLAKAILTLDTYLKVVCVP